MPTINAAEQAVWDWLQSDYPQISSALGRDGLFQLRRQLMRNDPLLKTDLTQMRRIFYQHLARLFAVPSVALVEQGMALFMQLRNQVQPYDDVPEVLARLQARFQLAALTNGNANVFQTPLSRFFEVQLSSADVMAAKPDPQMFVELAQRLGLETHQMLHIGDDPLHDIQGACRAGIDAIWLNRDARDWPKDLGCSPLAICKTLREVEQQITENKGK